MSKVVLRHGSFVVGRAVLSRVMVAVGQALEAEVRVATVARADSANGPKANEPVQVRS